MNNKKRTPDNGSTWIARRDLQVEILRRSNLLNDTFLSVALNDREACQHVLRILTGIKDLSVREVRTQYSLSKLVSHSARMDVLAEDRNRHFFHLEIQRKDTDDHPRRVRFYSAAADSELLEKGLPYDALPERYVIYITETDIWKSGQTAYPVLKHLGSTDRRYEDGEHILYVNTALDDGSRIAKLMRYFKTANPDDLSEGALSRRVRFLKCEEGGRKIMCEISDAILKEGITIGKQKGRRQTKLNIARNMAAMGMAADTIAQAVGENVDLVRKWLASAPKSRV